jgi:hypothetical protein
MMEEPEKKKKKDDDDDDKTPLEKVEQKFFEEATDGVLLNPKDLRAYCKEEGIKPCPSESELWRLRKRWKYIGIHARWVKPPAYVGSSVDKLGNIFVDVAEFKKNLRVANKGRWIILVGTDLLSQKLSAIAFPNKSQASWERGITQFIEKDFPCVNSIVSDRDRSISGAGFQKMIRDKFGVDWIHLRSRSKVSC